MKTNPRVSLMVSIILTSAWTAPGQDRAITDGWAEPPYVTVSQRMPERPHISQLPIAGEIQWTHEPMPFIAKGPRGGVSGAAFVDHGGALYLAGGFIPLGDGSDDPSYRTSRWVHRYDLAAKTWKQLPDLPGRVEYTRGAVHGNSFFVLGGGTQRKAPAGVFTGSSDVFVLDLSAETPAWRTHSQLKVPRTHPSVGVVGHYLVAIGGNEPHYDRAKGILGMHPTTIRNTTEVLDLNAPAAGWRQAAPIPGAPLGWAASATVGDRFYVFGGLTIVTRADGKPVRMKLDGVLSYDPAADRWTEHAKVPFAISGWAAAPYRDRYVILVGGVQAEVVSSERMGQNTFNDMAFLYDTVDGKWLRFEGLLPVGGVYNDPGVAIVGETIYVAGGEGPKASHFDHLAIGAIRLTGAR